MRKVTSLLGVGVITGAMILGMVACNDDDDKDKNGDTTPVATSESTPAVEETSTPAAGETGTPAVEETGTPAAEETETPTGG